METMEAMEVEEMEVEAMWVGCDGGRRKWR